MNSKFLSYVLRHAPEKSNLQLDKQGWCSVESIINNCNITFNELKSIVDNDGKTRYAFNSDFTQIRANQGHSINVKLIFTKKVPPVLLYHGGDFKAKDLILKYGLQKMTRHHVHLSADLETAMKVGSRRKRYIIFEIDAKSALEDGIEFFISDNKVWLTDNVPPKYLKIKSI